MLFAGREVRIEKTVPEVLHKDGGQRLMSVNRPRAQFFLIRTSRLANNIFIYFFVFFYFAETFVGFARQEFAIICWQA